MILKWLYRESVWFTGACLIYCILAFWAVWSENYILMLVPLGAAAAIFFLKDVRLPFVLLCGSIPFSFNLMGMTNIGMDFPDEALMLWTTAMFPFFLLLNPFKFSVKKWIRHPLLWLQLLAFLWMCISVLYSENVVLSSKYLLKRIWYLVPFLIWPLFLFQDRKLMIRCYQWMFLTLLLVTCIVLIRFSAVGFRFEEVHDPLQPFFINHVMYGSMLSCFIPLAAGAIFLSRKFSIQWMLAIIGLFVFVLAVYLSYSRAAWMGVIFAMGTWLFIRLKWMHQAMLVFFALVLSAVLWLSQNNTYLNYKPKFEKTIMHESLEDHIMATIQGTDISSAERYYRWIAAIRMSQDRPITGVGPNNFYDYYKSYTITSFRTWVSRNFERSTTHNYFLFMLVEQGYPAMILYAAMIWSIFFFGQRLYHRLSDKGEKIIVISVICMLASLFINNFFSELLETDKIGSLFLLGIAVLVIFDLKKSPKYPASGIGVEI